MYNLDASATLAAQVGGRLGRPWTRPCELIPPTIKYCKRSDAMTKVRIAHNTRHWYLMPLQLYLEDNVYRKDDPQAHAVVLVRPPSFFSFNVF